MIYDDVALSLLYLVDTFIINTKVLTTRFWPLVGTSILVVILPRSKHDHFIFTSFDLHTGVYGLTQFRKLRTFCKFSISPILRFCKLAFPFVKLGEIVKLAKYPQFAKSKTWRNVKSNHLESLCEIELKKLCEIELKNFAK